MVESVKPQCRGKQMPTYMGHNTQSIISKYKSCFGQVVVNRATTVYGIELTL